MALRASGPRTSKSREIVQDSRLLNLPPELRNLIYEFVAKGSSSVSVTKDEVLYSPAFGLVCRQIWKEFREIYLDEAPEHAPRVNVHVADFVAPGTVELPAPVATVERSWTVRVVMTNLWDRHQVRMFLGSSCLKDEYDLEVVWDPKSFDVQFLREAIPKLRFCHARTSLPTADLRWSQLDKAFTEALERYLPLAKEARVKAKRKRRLAAVEKTPMKSLRRR